MDSEWDDNDPPGTARSRAAVQAVIDRLYLEDPSVEFNGSRLTVSSTSIPRDEGEALRQWVEREDAVRTIETGFGFGMSSLFICQGLLTRAGAGAEHVAIDPLQSEAFASRGLQSISEAGLEGLVEPVLEPSEVVLPRLLYEGRTFDVGFVDGNHRFEHVFLDLIYMGRIVRDGGVIFVDDLQLPAIERALSFCTTNLGWEELGSSHSHPSHHWMVLRTPAPRLDRTFDDYFDF